MKRLWFIVPSNAAEQRKSSAVLLIMYNWHFKDQSRIWMSLVETQHCLSEHHNASKEDQFPLSPKILLPFVYFSTFSYIPHIMYCWVLRFNFMIYFYVAPTVINSRTPATSRIFKVVVSNGWLGYGWLLISDTDRVDCVCFCILCFWLGMWVAVTWQKVHNYWNSLFYPKGSHRLTPSVEPYLWRQLGGHSLRMSLWQPVPCAWIRSVATGGNVYAPIFHSASLPSINRPLPLIYFMVAQYHTLCVTGQSHL